MIRLIAVEARRFVARRLFRVLTLLVIAGFSLGGVIAFVASDNSPGALDAYRAERAAAVDVCTRETEARIAANVEEMPGAARTDPRAYCEDETWVEHPSFEYRELDWMLMGFALPMMVIGWLFGASFVGAEWHNRTITTLLTWEPRRIRVFAAKAIAAAVIVVAWVLAFQAIAALAFYPAARFQGSLAGVDAEWWWNTVAVMVRAGALGGVAAGFGFALAAVGRSTAAALGVGFGYFAVVEGLIRAFKPSWIDWLVGPNIALVLNGAEDQMLGHSQAAGGLLLAAYVAGAVSAALIVIRSRDIA